MEVMEVRTGTRTIEIVSNEIENLNKLIMQREEWLADSANRSKGTYSDTKRDTVNMIFEYKELVEELNELKKAQ